MNRYKAEDDFGKPTSSFTICTFWLIEALFVIGEKEEARRIFESMISYSNHVLTSTMRHPKIASKNYHQKALLFDDVLA